MTDIVIPYPLGDGLGGIPRVIQSVTSEIDEFNFEVLTPKVGEGVEEMFDDVSLREFDKKIPGWGLDYRRPSIKRELRKYDLIWNHSLMLNDICAKSKTPALTSFHSIEHQPPTGFPLSVRKVKKRVQWKLLMRGFRHLSNCDRVAGVSDRSRNVAERRTGANAVRIYNGADYLGSELSGDDEGYIFSADNPRAAIYVASKTDFPAKVLGGSESLREMASRTGAEAEFIEDFVSDEELRDLYRKCSFYVYGAYTDGFGLTPLEANHFGKPAVVFDKEVHSENVENGVNGFKAANMKEMVEKSRELAEDEKLRKEMGKSAYEYAQRFRWEKAAEQYREEFLSVIA